MERGARVLVVDELTETADVLRAILEPQGFLIEQARGAAMAGLVQQFPDHPSRPALLVVDAESAMTRGLGMRACGDVPRVIIGTIPPCPPEGGPAGAERRLKKPFQYAELVRAIESLIGSPAPRD